MQPLNIEARYPTYKLEIMKLLTSDYCQSLISDSMSFIYMDKNEVIKSLQYLKIELSKQFDIKNLYLFGSYSCNKQNKNSDIDVAIVVDKVIGNYLEFVSSVWNISGGINSLIEPVVFVEGQNDPSGFLEMIKKTGIEVN